MSEAKYWGTAQDSIDTDYYECLSCGCDNIQEFYNYCPNCGEYISKLYRKNGKELLKGERFYPEESNIRAMK